MHPASPHPTAIGFRALLRDRAFMQLWIGQIISQLADKIFLTLQVALLENTNRYALPEFLKPWMGADSRLLLLFIASTVPAILLGSAAGIFVDRRRKKSILFHCNLWRALMLILLPFLPGGYVMLVAIVFAESILTQFFAPAEQSTLPFIVRSENLVAANSLFATTMISSIVVGHAVASPIFDLVSHWSHSFGKEITVGILYFLGAVILGSLPMRERLHKPEVSIHPWQDFKAGLRYLRKSRLVSNAMVQLMMIYSVFASLTVLSIRLTNNVRLRPDQFGFLVASAGIGMVLGAAFLNLLHDRLHHRPLPFWGALSVSTVLFAFAFVNINLLKPILVSWLGLGLTDDTLKFILLGMALFLSFLLGIGSVLIVIPMQTLIQQETPESMRGKVFGFQNNVINIAISLPLVLTEFCVQKLTLSPVLILISAIVASVGYFTWRTSRRILQDAI
ncbi:MAG: MFS transporter [Synechococcales bacterium]|nr:MFS transporter [Synechococcales bacterium]